MRKLSVSMLLLWIFDLTGTTFLAQYFLLAVTRAICGRLGWTCKMELMTEMEAMGVLSPRQGTEMYKRWLNYIRPYIPEMPGDFSTENFGAAFEAYFAELAQHNQPSPGIIEVPGAIALLRKAAQLGAVLNCTSAWDDDVVAAILRAHQIDDLVPQRHRYTASAWGPDKLRDKDAAGLAIYSEAAERSGFRLDQAVVFEDFTEPNPEAEAKARMWIWRFSRPAGRYEKSRAKMAKVGAPHIVMEDGTFSSIEVVS